MAARPFLIIALIAIALLAGCVQHKPQTSTEQYHDKNLPDAPPPLNGLQKEALRLMNLNQFESAIDYLQRAIRVEPRNPMNWHLLAQNYWHLKQMPRCRDMIQRSRAYLQYQPDLAPANDILYEQCQ